MTERLDTLTTAWLGLTAGVAVVAGVGLANGNLSAVLVALVVAGMSAAMAVGLDVAITHRGQTDGLWAIRATTLRVAFTVAAVAATTAVVLHLAGGGVGLVWTVPGVTALPILGRPIPYEGASRWRQESTRSRW